MLPAKGAAITFFINGEHDSEVGGGMVGEEGPEVQMGTGNKEFFSFSLFPSPLLF